MDCTAQRQHQPEIESPPAANLVLPWRELLVLLIASRVVMMIIAGLSLPIIEKGPYFASPQSAMDWFFHWDAGWYHDIAANGYSFREDGAPSNVVFLPLYPALMRLASLGGLIPLKVAGYLVSLGCLWGACVWLWRAVAREWRDPHLATISVTFLLLGPVSFFFSTVYSEALFLLLVIGCVTFAREKRWWLAGALGALAACTRFVGVVLIVPLLWEFVASHLRERRSLGEVRLGPLVACLLPVAGFAAYCLLMWIETGDPLIYFRGQLHWDRRVMWWWDFFARYNFTSQNPFHQLWFAGTALAAFGLMILGVWLKVPLAYTIFALTFGFVYISSHLVEALPRYFSVVFPLYVVVALGCRRWPGATTPLLALSVSLQSLSVILFVNGYWFT